MTLRPDCLTCYDTGFYHDKALTVSKHQFGISTIYPSILCTCDVAVKWLEEGGENGWRKNTNFRLGMWDGYCHSTHPTHFTWYAREGIWVPLDFGIIDDIKYMWKLDLDTLFSCEGEGDGRLSTRYIKFASLDDALTAADRLGWVQRVDEKHNAVYARP